MTDKELEGFIEVRHAVDAVPYPKFAELIGKKPATVKSMIEDGKLPIIPWKNPESLGAVLRTGSIFLSSKTAQCVTPITTVRENSATPGCCGSAFEVIAMSQKTANHENRCVNATTFWTPI